MTDFPLHLLLLACGSFLLLAVSTASATAQFLRSKQAETALVVTKRPPLR